MNIHQTIIKLILSIKSFKTSQSCMMLTLDNFRERAEITIAEVAITSTLYFTLLHQKHATGIPV